MKRMIALVLSLVMALSLCAPAWGAGEATKLPNPVNGVITLTEDVTLAETYTIAAGKTVVLDLNGKTITGTTGRDADNNRVHVLVNNGTLTVKNGTVKSAGNDGGSAIYNNAGANLTIEDVTLYGAPQSDPVYEAGVSKPFPSYAVNNYGNAVVNGATVKSYHGAIATGGNGVTVINDADIDVGLGQSTGITSYAIYSYENAQVTVNDGKFAFTKQEIYVNGGNTFCELGTNPIIVNGGNYTGTSFSIGAGREYVIKGGTFDKDPTAYVAEGSNVTANGNGTWTVTTPPDVAEVNGVGYKTLQAALDAAEENGDTVKLLDNLRVNAVNYNYQDTFYSAAFITSGAIDGAGKNLTMNLDGDLSNTFGIWSWGDITGIKNLTLNSNTRSVLLVESNTVDCIIEGVTIAAAGNAIHMESSKNIVLRNNTFTTTDDGGFNWSAAVFAGYGANVTIESGTYTGEKAIYTGGNPNFATITITGGTFNGNVVVQNNDKLIIKGGTFSVDVSQYVAEGYICVPSGENTYTVQKKVTTESVNTNDAASVNKVASSSDMVAAVKTTDDTTVTVAETTIELTAEGKNAFQTAITNSATTPLEIETEIAISDVSNTLDSGVAADLETELKDVAGDDAKVAAILDIDIHVFVNDQHVGQLTELPQPITITLDLPEIEEELKTGYRRSYFVIIHHDDVAEKIPATVSGDKLIITSDRFSPYALGYVDTEIPAGGYYPYYPSTSDKLVESAKTADPVGLYFGVTALATLGSALLLKKKED